MPASDDLVRLLTFPHESLSVEYKSWLILSETHAKATLAKAAIALANHGGGTVVIGMRENNAQGGALTSQTRPDDLGRYNQDDVNAAINRYADPEFHCELSFAKHPETGIEHAFIRVPGKNVPVMSGRSFEGVIAAQRCYIRKPGPRSEEPHTGAEWHQLLDRCVMAGRENMLDAIRGIVLGHAGAAPSKEAANRLNEFVSNAQQRWQELIEPLPSNHVARMVHGHYELAFQIMDVQPAPNLNDLRRRLKEAGQVKHTGWPPFGTLHEKSSYPTEGLIEAWPRATEVGAFRLLPPYWDFWRAHPDGRLFLLRGYEEDRIEPAELGTYIDIIRPIQRVGEAMLYISRLARTFDHNPKIIARCHYFGLQGRILISGNSDRDFLVDDETCIDHEKTIETQATAIEIDENLAEVLRPMLVPFYELFSYFELSMPIVVEEIKKMRQRRY